MLEAVGPIPNPQYVGVDVDKTGAATMVMCEERPDGAIYVLDFAEIRPIDWRKAKKIRRKWREAQREIVRTWQRAVKALDS